MTSPRPLHRGRARSLLVVLVTALVATALGCGASEDRGSGRPTVVVTYPVLGAVVADVVGEAATVRVLMGNGVDPHDWSPSAKDIEQVRKADLVVTNGLGLETGLLDTLDDAGHDGVAVFAATDHLRVREGHDTDHRHAADGDEAAAQAADGDKTDGHATDGHAEGHTEGGDPHFWVDPVSMAAVVTALGEVLQADLGLDVGARVTAVLADLEALDREVRAEVDSLPPERRKLVTGHESLGYFADRYGFTLIGAVVPGTSSQAETSAAQLAALRDAVRAAGLEVVFTEIGTPAAVAATVARETGARLVDVPTLTLPDDGSYRSFIATLVATVVDALRG